IHVRIDFTGAGDKPKEMSWLGPARRRTLGGRPVKTLPLYRSESLRDDGRLPIICEGEKATDAVNNRGAAGVLALGTVTGAPSGPTRTILHLPITPTPSKPRQLYTNALDLLPTQRSSVLKRTAITRGQPTSVPAGRCS